MNKTNSMRQFDRESFKVSNSKNFDFLQDQLGSFSQSNLPSPINKMKFELSQNISQQDILNYSSNTFIGERHLSNHKSYTQSPQKENTINTKINFLAAKKLSIPDAKILNDFSYKNDQNWNNRFRKNEIPQNSKLLRKLNGKKGNFKLENEQQSQNLNIFEHEKFLSQKRIENYNPSDDSQKYTMLSKSYHQLLSDYEMIKQENSRLKRSRQDFMNQNLKIKREANQQINTLSSEIESLKEQLYHLQMSSQSSNRGFCNNRLSLSRDTASYSGRGTSQSQGMVNLFYVQQLEKQNDQLIRQNKRLNEIVMKRLKNTVFQ